jgi:hypothetical protein
MTRNYAGITAAPYLQMALPNHQVIRDVNDRIRAAASALGDIDDMPASFMCQCGCLGVVRMSLSEYDDRSTQGVWAHGHKPVTEAFRDSLDARTSFHYRMYDRDGNEAGDAHYAMPVQPGEAIWTGGRYLLRVVVVIPTSQESEGYADVLLVEAI